ncbi:MAG: hypothetical protein EOM80_11255 [Erysipelotrichia bacterium]|nr:FliG C-terminal domain-containing protein [Candidatus Riflebacteria bacterium]NCB39333.1 hypothetical protein [Erysipelotrichia bacterium]
MARSLLGKNSGLEILANIMQHCNARTNKHILGRLQKEIPQIAAELRKKVFLFEDLAYADPRGLQKMFKLIHIKDMAISLKGAPPSVLKNLAGNMSQNALADLKNEITTIGKARESDIEAARERIMMIAGELINNNELFITRQDEPLY